MIIWKTISDTEGKSFPLAHPEHESQSPVRKVHFANSRMALIKCFKDPQLKGPKELKNNPTLKELLITDHHHLTHFPTLLVSLAHTRGLAAACVAEESKECFGVGIDCELKTRSMKQELLNKFSHGDDIYENELNLWCAKEAAFKASSAHWNKEKPFVLKDIIIHNGTFEVPELLKGELSYEISGKYLITIAVVTELL